MEQKKNNSYNVPRYLLVAWFAFSILIGLMNIFVFHIPRNQMDAYIIDFTKSTILSILIAVGLLLESRKLAYFAYCAGISLGLLHISASAGSVMIHISFGFFISFGFATLLFAAVMCQSMGKRAIVFSLLAGTCYLIPQVMTYVQNWESLSRNPLGLIYSLALAGINTISYILLGLVFSQMPVEKKPSGKKRNRS